MFFYKYFYSLVFIFLTSIFLFHYAITGQAVYGDGVGYYAHLHSWYFDRDLNFTNEYQHIYSPQNNNSTKPITSPTVQIVTTDNYGQALNHFSPGPALFWLPFYILADGLVIALNSFGVNLARNGYSNIYQISVGIGSIIYGLAGIYFSEKLCSLLGAKEKIAKLSALGITLATSLLYYISFDVINSHSISFFLAALFWWQFLKSKKQTKDYFYLGLISGLMTLVRPQDGLVIILIIVDLLIKFIKKQHNALKFAIVSIGTWSLSLSILLFQWKIIFGKITAHTYSVQLIKEFPKLLSLDTLLGNLFHQTNGLFSRTPMLLLAFIYFIWLINRKKTSYSILLMSAFFFIQWFIVSLQGGWKAAAYGGRMYISSLPFFIVLVAKFTTTLTDNKKAWLAWSLLSFFVSLNVISIISFVLLEKETASNFKGTEIKTVLKLTKKVIK